MALARTLVVKPRVLLLDEPLSALDRQLRDDMRTEIRALVKEVGITTILVTHDQDEALAMADRVAVMRDGRLEQWGTPEALYSAPANCFVAGFLGRINELGATSLDDSGEGFAVDFAGGSRARLPCPDSPPREGVALRVLARVEATGFVPAGEGMFDATVAMRQFMGAHVELLLHTDAQEPLRVELRGDAPVPAPGSRCGVRLSGPGIFVYPA